MRIRTSATLVAYILFVGAISGYAIPQVINYQGILTNGGGTPITVATNVEFRIWNAGAAGDELWTESQLVDPDDDGLFNVLLGTINPIPDSALKGAVAFLGIRILPDAEMTPRTQFVAVAYAFRPGTVDGASGGNITSKVTIGAGHTNTGADAFVAGSGNSATGDNSVIGGGVEHDASGAFATISGGRDNTVVGTVGTVGGGIGNSASGSFAPTVAGGESNTASGSRSTIGGGSSNIADSIGATIGGGRHNRVRGRYSVVSGGGGDLDADSNYATGAYSTIGGGKANASTGTSCTVAGGQANVASGVASAVGGGVVSIATGNWATVPGGWFNSATGSHSFAAGGSANAIHDGAVVITADHSPNSLNPVISDTTGQMVLMAARSYCFTNATGTAPHVAGRFINTSTGAYLGTGGTWTNSSDENKKENFAAINRSELLDKVAALDIRRWNYKGDLPEVQHIGPTAQDFHSLFHVGNDNKTISTIDPAGVALAAIQELDKRTRNIEQLSRENADLRSEVNELREMVEALVKRQH